MAILTVGSNQQYSTLSSAIAASHNGDTIYVQHGTYTNDFSIINTNVNIVGVGGMVQLVATASPPNGKAILTTNSDVTIDHVEFSGAVVPDANGAGIRYQNGHLTITNSYFHDNQMGLLAAGVTTGSVTIDHSEFGHNIVADGSALGHNLYIGGPLGNFKVTNSYFHDAVEGHELKSRALNSDIENNRIFDNNSTASYSIDLPNGGNAIVKNNIIQQSPNSENSIIIAYSAETQSPWSGSQLQVSGNTIINQMSGAGIGVRNFSNSVTASITGNHIFGLTPARVAVGPNTQSGNDTLVSQPALDTSHPWAASPWDNLISGGAAADVLNGTSTRDLLAGGAGNDTFNVKAGGASDSIADFATGSGPGDVARLDGYGFSNFAAVQAAMTQSGDNAVLNLGNGETLTFLHALKSAFAADDFTTAGSATPPATTPIETAGLTTLATGSNHYYLLDKSTGLGPSLKYAGTDVVTGQFGATPIGAEKTATGHEVAWKTPGVDQYYLWNTDSSGNFVANLVSRVPGSNPTLQSHETLFQQDLNGDGVIGTPASGPPATTPIETAGLTTLATGSNHYYLLDKSTGLGPSLKYAGTDVVTGQFGATPIGAEKTATGHEVAWKTPGVDQYYLWNTDSSGNFVANLVSRVPGSNPTLQSHETLFQQDLNGDGVIGTPASGPPATTPIETAGLTTLATGSNHYYLLDKSTELGPSLKYAGTDVVTGQFGATPIGAEKTATGHEVAWKTPGVDQYYLWNTDNSGNFVANLVSRVPGSNPTLQSHETLFQQDLNGDGHIGGAVATITADRVASGLSGALDVTAPPNDFGRLFIVQQSGQISVLNLTSGQVTPFLNVAVDSSGERGLLGLTFDPEYATNGFFYIYRTVPGSPAHNEIERYHVSANPNVADPSSATSILNLGNLSGATNHNGGWIDFGSDGYLYAATGENANPANAQDINNLLGKIIRIDVHNDAFPSDPAKNYAIPSDNMFAATAGADEIFALGLRNPFRNSFDRATGDLYIADVGQNTWEEIDIGKGGANYGWSLYEGPSGSGTVAAGTLTAPIHSYNHSVGNAIIGGYVYRGQGDGLQGDLFFADLNGKIFTLHSNGTSWVATERTQQIHTNTGAINTPTSFGEDAHGNLYITDIDGDVFRLTPVGASFVQNDASESTKVDTLSASGHGSGDRIDVSSLIDVKTKIADDQNFDPMGTVFSNQPAELIAAEHGDSVSIADAILAVQSNGLTIPADPTHIGADLL